MISGNCAVTGALITDRSLRRNGATCPAADIMTATRRAVAWAAIAAMSAMGIASAAALRPPNRGSHLPAVAAFATCMVAALLVYRGRRDLLAPAPLGAVFFSAAFVGTAPVWAYVAETTQGGIVVPHPDDLPRTLLAALTGLLGFAVGARVKASAFIAPLEATLGAPSRGRRPRPIDCAIVCAIACLASAARLRLRMNSVGLESFQLSARYVTGIIYFGLTIAPTVACTTVLGFCIIKRADVFSRMLCIAGVLSVCLAHAASGWRGAAVGTVIMLAVVYWYTSALSLVRASIYAGVGLWAAVVVTNFGHAARTTNLQRVPEPIAESRRTAMAIRVIRMDGAGRLAKVLEHETRQGLSLLNGAKAVSIWKQWGSSTRYADRNVWGITEAQRTSTGASGPGSLYILGGLLGVTTGYILFGVVCSVFYLVVLRCPRSPAASATYAYLVTLMPGIWSECAEPFQPLKQLLVAVVVAAAVNRWFVVRGVCELGAVVPRKRAFRPSDDCCGPDCVPRRGECH